jgi:hypothetical protein
MISAFNGIEISEICEVRAGHGTDTFNTAVKHSSGGKPSFVPMVAGHEIPRRLCFSLVFKDPRQQTLDLVADDQGG